MEQFPSDFTREESEKKVADIINKSSGLADARKYTYDQYVKSLQAPLDYFTLDLTPYSYLIRESLLIELLQKFPVIGYRVDPLSGNMRKDKMDHLNLINIFLTKPGQQYDIYKGRIVKLKSDKPDQYQKNYVVATTKNCGYNLDSYEW